MSALSGCSNRRASNCSTGPRAASRRHLPVGSGQGAGRRPGQPIQHRVDPRSALGHQGRHPLRRQWPGRRRSQRSGVRPELLAYGADQMQPFVRAPEQRSLTEVVDGAPYGSEIGAQQFGDVRRRVAGSGSAARPSADLPLPGGETVQGAGHRAGGGGLGGQVGQVVRDRLGQIRVAAGAASTTLSGCVCRSASVSVRMPDPRAGSVTGGYPQLLRTGRAAAASQVAIDHGGADDQHDPGQCLRPPGQQPPPVAENAVTQQDREQQDERQQAHRHSEQGPRERSVRRASGPSARRRSRTRSARGARRCRRSPDR